MSHKATNWAIEQRGIKPATKLVLWHLCDRHNPDKGCFPEQARLAEDCEMSRSSVNDQLKILEEKGLIRRIKRVNKQTKKQQSTLYKFPFEEDFQTTHSESEIRTRKEVEAVSEKPAEPCPKNGESRVQNLDTNPVREPVREPLSGECASEDGSGEPEREVLRKREKDIEKSFWTIIKDWPGFEGMPKEKAKTAWWKLSDDERHQAQEKRDDWFALLKSHKKSHTPAPYTYFHEKLWMDVPDGPEPSELPLVAKAFGRPWMALRLHLLKQARKRWQPTGLMQTLIDQGKGHTLAPERRRGQFPEVARMDAEANTGRPWTIPPSIASFDTDAFVRVKVGSDQWEQWQAWHDAMDYPLLPTPQGQERWVWMPTEQPPAIPVEDQGDHRAFG